VSRNAERIIRDVQRINQMTSALPDKVIVELVRRGGKAESPAKSGDRVSVARGSYNDPTGDAVAHRLDSDRLETDPVFQAVKKMAQCLREMADLARRVEHHARFVLETKERNKEAEIVHCAACLREVANTPNDRLRSGYCPMDYMRWLRAGKPYRLTFEISIRNALNEVPGTHSETPLENVG
jgi:hypothetical protein